jgi:branched-chain amino acid transport system ATP-binding protein
VSELLAATGVSAGYGGHPVVRDLNLAVHSGEVVALLGPNGAGKTTSLLTLAGDLQPLAGTVSFAGLDPRASLHRRARNGLSLVTEERSVIMRLSVDDNLRVGRCDARLAFELFPELRPLRKRVAGLLSGGEQQMLTLARALARKPKLLLADELSLGLAPLVVQRLLKAVRKAADEDGIGVLLVEQHVSQALRFADRAYVMTRGRITLHGTSAEVGAKLEEVEGSYFSQGI